MQVPVRCCGVLRSRRRRDTGRTRRRPQQPDPEREAGLGAEQVLRVPADPGSRMEVADRQLPEERPLPGEDQQRPVRVLRRQLRLHEGQVVHPEADHRDPAEHDTRSTKSTARNPAWGRPQLHLRRLPGCERPRVRRRVQERPRALRLELQRDLEGSAERDRGTRGRRGLRADGRGRVRHGAHSARERPLSARSRNASGIGSIDSFTWSAPPH